MINFENILNRIKLKYTNDQTLYINEEEFDMITDEIEKSLLEIKEVYDIPTEEIETSLNSRRVLRKTRNSNTR